MVAHTVNLSTWWQREGIFEFQASQGYILRLCLKKKNKIKYMARPDGLSFIPSTWETEAERSVCEFKASQYNETLRPARETLRKSLNTKMKQKDVFSHYAKILTFLHS